MTTPSENKPLPGARNISTHEILRELARYKWLLLFLGITLGSGTFWFLKNRLLKNPASASFYLNDNNSLSLTAQNTETKPLDGLLTGDNFNRVYQLITSTRTLNYMIRKFSLYEHYHLDSTREFAYERALEKLRNSIDIKKSPYNLVTVTVNDEYRYRAAEMANELVSFVDRLNKTILIESLQKKIRIYTSLIADLRKETEVRHAEMDSLLQQLNSAAARMDNRAGSADKLLAIEQRLSALTGSMESSNTELQRILRYYSLANQIISERNLPTLMMIQYATPNPHSLALKAAVFTLPVLLFFLTFFILFLYWKLRYREYFVLFFKHS